MVQDASHATCCGAIMEMCVVDAWLSTYSVPLVASEPAAIQLASGYPLDPGHWLSRVRPTTAPSRSGKPASANVSPSGCSSPVATGCCTALSFEFRLLESSIV